jgi:hypothetical protein
VQWTGLVWTEDRDGWRALVNGVQWTGLVWTEDRDGWRALVNAVMNLWVSQNAGISHSLRNCKLLTKDAAPWS